MDQQRLLVLKPRANYSRALSQNNKPPRDEAGRLIARYCCVQDPIIIGK